MTKPSPYAAGFACRCPNCGRASIYSGGPFSKGLLSLVDQCPACGFDLRRADPGDGPAVFVILILGFVAMALVLWVEFTFNPPVWVHVLIWPPFLVIAGVWMLRVTKALLVALQFHHKAGEGRLDE